jgi:hypothetical protein
MNRSFRLACSWRHFRQQNRRCRCRASKSSTRATMFQIDQRPRLKENHLNKLELKIKRRMKNNKCTMYLICIRLYLKKIMYLLQGWKNEHLKKNLQITWRYKHIWYTTK